jgi:hypothetical protein
MTHDVVDPAERTRFEDALQAMPVEPPALAELSRRVGRERTRRAMRRIVATAAAVLLLVVGGAFASSSGVVAAVRALLAPTHETTLIAFEGRRMVMMQAVRDAADVRDREPFALYTPPGAWRLAKLVVSAPGEAHVVEALYRGANGGWLKTTQRPLHAPGSDDDADLSDLLESANLAQKDVGVFHFVGGARVIGSVRTQRLGDSRVVLATIPASYVPGAPRVDIENACPKPRRVTSMIPKGSHPIKLGNAIDFRGRTKLCPVIDQNGHRGFMILPK